LPPESRLPLASSCTCCLTSTGIHPVPGTHWFGKHTSPLAAHIPSSGVWTQTCELLQVSVVQAIPSSQSVSSAQPVHAGGTWAMSQIGASALQPWSTPSSGTVSRQVPHASEPTTPLHTPPAHASPAATV